MRPHLLPRGARILPPSAEQPGEQRHQRHADERHAAAGHELFHALAFCTRVVVAIPFQQVDDAPDAEAGPEGDDQRLQHVYRTVEKLHPKTRGLAAQKRRLPAQPRPPFNMLLKAAVFPWAS